MQSLPNPTSASAILRCALEAASNREAAASRLAEVKKSMRKHRKELKSHRLGPHTIVVCRPSALADIRQSLDKYSII